MPYIVQFYKERKITKYCSTHLLSGKMLFVTFNFLTAMKSFLMPLYSTLLIAVTSLTLMYEVLHKQTNHGRWEPTRSIRERTTESLKPLTSPRASPSHTHRFLSASTQSSDLTLVRPLLTTLTKHSTLPLCRTPFHPPSFFPYHLIKHCTFYLLLPVCLLHWGQNSRGQVCVFALFTHLSLASRTQSGREEVPELF